MGGGSIYRYNKIIIDNKVGINLKFLRLSNRYLGIHHTIVFCVCFNYFHDKRFFKCVTHFSLKMFIFTIFNWFLRTLCGIEKFALCYRLIINNHPAFFSLRTESLTLFSDIPSLPSLMWKTTFILHSFSI